MLEIIDRPKLEMQAQLWGSFTLFLKVFFPLITSRPFTVPAPVGRECHFITVGRALTAASRLEILSLIINMPPGYGKSTLCSFWVAWTLSRYPDSQYLYISYGKHLAAKHTEMIRRIVSNQQYQDLFGIRIKADSRAKDSFQVEQGGSIKAFGSSGAITGQDAGLPNLDRFSGALIIDDPHKPDEVHSDLVREGVIQNYRETILQRPRGPNVPLIFIGQCLHEADLAAFLKSGQDERKWKQIVLQALDENEHALYPSLNSREQLIEKREKTPYVFASQYQQNPIPAGGSLFKDRDFPSLIEEPESILTFITADTAETEKTYNDATAFMFWGLYFISDTGTKTQQLALHSLDCWELRVEPKDLETSFLSFYSDCMQHKTQPLIAVIEDKSTGVTLASTLSQLRGLQIRKIKPTRAMGSKIDRFIDMQGHISSKLISFTEGAKHRDVVVSHMMKITANGAHRHDDICDAIYYAVKVGLMDKSLYNPNSNRSAKIVSNLVSDLNQRMHVSRMAQDSWRNR